MFKMSPSDAYLITSLPFTFKSISTEYTSFCAIAVVSVSVISPSAMEADIMATTLFAKGDLSFTKKNLEAIFVTKDREIFYTSGVKNFKLLHDEFVLQNKKVE